MSDIWQKRDQENPKNARKFRRHNPGMYSDLRILSLQDELRIEVKTDNAMIRQAQQQGSIGTR